MKIKNLFFLFCSCSSIYDTNRMKEEEEIETLNNKAVNRKTLVIGCGKNFKNHRHDESNNQETVDPNKDLNPTYPLTFGKFFEEFSSEREYSTIINECSIYPDSDFFQKSYLLLERYGHLVVVYDILTSIFGSPVFLYPNLPYSKYCLNIAEKLKVENWPNFYEKFSKKEKFRNYSKDKIERFAAWTSYISEERKLLWYLCCPVMCCLIPAYFSLKEELSFSSQDIIEKSNQFIENEAKKHNFKYLGCFLKEEETDQIYKLNQKTGIFEQIDGNLKNLENLIDPYGRASHVFQKI
jgi:hypothetical protein